MNRYIQKNLIFSFFLMVATAAYAENCRTPTISTYGEAPLLFDQADALIDSVRDSRTDRVTAISELGRLLPLIGEHYRRAGGREYARAEWVFPLAGYNPKAVTGGKSKGFVAQGYDFFTGNRHGGHPAYDIFIRDRNQDDLDDRTKKPVAVLSMTGGIVVSVETDWQPGSKLRGGKYIWIYDPYHDLLVYYAHNREVLVKAGDLVKPGDKLAELGRSGYNAAKKRSPTHLHLTMLKANLGMPKAVRFWGDLVKTTTVSCD